MQCPTCGSEMRLIPAGVSRTSGKPYNQFFSCPNRCPKPPRTFGPASGSRNQGIAEAQNRKGEMIEKAQDRKDEGMRTLNSKKGAADITVALLEKGLIQQKDIEITFARYCQYIYEYEPNENSPYNTGAGPDDEIRIDNIPF